MSGKTSRPLVKKYKPLVKKYKPLVKTSRPLCSFHILALLIGEFTEKQQKVLIYEIIQVSQVSFYSRRDAETLSLTQSSIHTHTRLIPWHGVLRDGQRPFTPPTPCCCRKHALELLALQDQRSSVLVHIRFVFILSS